LAAAPKSPANDPGKDPHPAPIPLFRELLKAEVPGWQSKTCLASDSPEKADFKLGLGKGETK